MAGACVAWAAVIALLIILAELLRCGALYFSTVQNRPTLASPMEALPGHLGLVSVIIPAKDEEQYIEQAVRSHLDADYELLEVIVVNDRSSDSTARIVLELASTDERITLVNVHHLPLGWTGKTHALFRGAAQARGDILLFTDADTVFPPDLISRALITYADWSVHVLSILPGFLRWGFWERLVYPHLAFGFAYFYPLADVNDSRKGAALASGAFLMMSAAVYRRLGTWERFRTEITEDVAFSRAVKAKGLSLLVVGMEPALRTRGFASLGELKSYWERTLYGGFDKSVRKLAGLSANYLVLASISVLFGFSLIISLVTTPPAITVVLLLLTFLTLVAVIVPYSAYLHEHRQPWWYGLLAPAGLFLSLWIAVSALRVTLYDRGVVWRDKRYR
jgi:cellulose synthase/poly-beta-1,6-N-acetylglucosamine synthase-like glycosyltransferase